MVIMGEDMKISNDDKMEIALRNRIRTPDKALLHYGVGERYKDVSEVEFNWKENHLITGFAGTGKTHKSVQMLKFIMLRKKGICLFKNVPQMMLDMRGSVKDSKDLELVKEIVKSDFLVLDDFGAEKNSEYNNHILYSIINQRYEQRKATIYITQLTMQEIAERYGDRIVSRMASGTREKLEGSDRRIRV